MPFTKVSSKRQITIPKSVCDTLSLEPGDILEVTAEKGKAVITPVRVVSKAPAPNLSKKEQQALARARKKIQAINEDLVNARGLTKTEADVAARVGLIDPEQIWWWLEEWQSGERGAEKDIRAGRLSGPFETADALIAHLHGQTG